MNIKNSFCLLIIAAFALTGCKKGATPKPAPVIPDPYENADVYVVGTTMTTNGHNIATYWKNGVEVKLGDSTNQSFGNAIAVNGTDVYITGNITDNTLKNIGSVIWKNGVATPLPSNSLARSIALSGNNVYITGVIPAPSVDALYIKNGNLVAPNSSSFINPLAISLNGNDVYVVGVTDHIINSFVTETAAYWKNGSEMQLENTNSNAYGIAVSGTDVYVAGTISDPATYTSTRAVYWKNGSRVALSPGFSHANAVALNGSDIYFAGGCVSFNQVTPVACYWKNGTIFQIGNPYYASDAFAMVLNGNDTYIAGDQGTSVTDGSKRPTFWRNGVAVLLPYYGNGQANGIVVIPH